MRCCVARSCGCRRERLAYAHRRRVRSASARRRGCGLPRRCSSSASPARCGRGVRGRARAAGFHRGSPTGSSAAVRRGLAAARTLLWAVGMALLATALARPQLGATEERVRRRGLDVVAVVDASRSMLARDTAPDRIGRAKLEIESLLDELAGDRIGLVTFSSEGFVQMPLTTDYAAARTFLRQIDPRQLPQGGTNIGAGLRTAQQLLSASSDKGAHVVLLFSDGEDWRGDAVDAAASLRKAGTTVYTVGVGTAAGAQVQSASGHTVVSRDGSDGADGDRARRPRRHVDRRRRGRRDRRASWRRRKRASSRSAASSRIASAFSSWLVAGLLALAAAALVTERRRRGKAARRRCCGGAGAVRRRRARERGASGRRHRSRRRRRACSNIAAAATTRRCGAFERAPAKGDARATVAYDRAAALYKLGRYDEARRALRGGGAGAGQRRRRRGARRRQQPGEARRQGGGDCGVSADARARAASMPMRATTSS